MATAVTDVETAPVSNLTFYCPSRDGRWKHVTIHTIPHTILPPITLEGGYDKVRTPRSRRFGLFRPSSTQPRPTTGQLGGKADVAQDSGSFHRLVPYVTMVSGDGRSFLRHVATATSTGIDKTSPQDSPGVPASSYPIKGQTRALQRGGDGRTKPEAKHKQAKAEDQHLKQSPLYSHFSPWDLGSVPSLIACNPYASTYV
jgi:hypothetical protein